MDKNEDAKWAKHYDDWETSGLTQVAYCKQANIKFGTFKNRAWRLKQRKRVGSFHQVKPVAEQRPDIYCEIRFSTHESIKIEGENTLNRLHELLTCLKP